MSNVLSEILQWSADRPVWQRDALRRLLVTEAITEQDIENLTSLCKAAHGLVPAGEAKPLAADHIAKRPSAGEPVSLVSITHHSGVNALAAEQTVQFGPNLTIVFGRNAAGKSGYTRILKRACRSRGIEDILGNVLTAEAPLTAKATISFRRGSEEFSFAWGQEAAAEVNLGAVSVFDSQCAPVYLKDKTDVAFRPFGLDVFDKLSTVCTQVRTRLENEIRQLESIQPRLPDVPANTRVRALLDGLTQLTDVDEVRRLAALAESDRQRLAALKQRLRDYQAADPKARGRELAIKAERLSAVQLHLKEVQTAVGAENMADLKATIERLRAAQKALEVIRRAAFSQAPLPGTGSGEWLSLWEAAREFSTIAYPLAEFPMTEEARCLLCQQPIGDDTATRFKHFAEYVASQAQADVQSAERARQGIVDQVFRIEVWRADVKLALDELEADFPQTASQVKQYLERAEGTKKGVGGAEKPDGECPSGIESAPIAPLETDVVELRERAAALQREKPELSDQEAQEVDELEARALLADALQQVIDEIERKKRLAAYRLCCDDTTTNAITRKSTELTKSLVTEQLRSRFKEELGRLDFTHLSVEIQAAGGTRGALFHHIVFTNAPGVNVASVLSEGESRAMSLAAFMTELSTTDARSTIVFDDPVSSLDHIWRDRIARRLAVEAKDRQVIVFTHDLVFLRMLLDHAEEQGVTCHQQYVRRNGQPGVCSAELPWLAMRTSDRVGQLRNLWQGAEKLHRTTSREAYEAEARKIYSLIRETWEQAIGEVLLNDVVERFRLSVQTQKARVLHDITPADCGAIEAGMTECSRWILGHDQAAAVDTPVPGPAEVSKQIANLDTWVKAIRQRRK